MSAKPLLHVERVEVCGPHALRVLFSDGVEKCIDATPLLAGPVFAPLHDPQVFARVALDPVSRTVVWPNGADLAPEALRLLPAIADVVNRNAKPGRADSRSPGTRRAAAKSK